MGLLIYTCTVVGSIYPVHIMHNYYPLEEDPGMALLGRFKIFTVGLDFNQTKVLQN